MLGKQLIARTQQYKRSSEENTNNHQQKSFLLNDLPDEILVKLSNTLCSAKDKGRLASVSRQFHCLFQSEIGKVEAKAAAEYVIYPTKENVDKLKTLLGVCPALLLHSVLVKNRYGRVIRGTIYQIALHEDDGDLIYSVIEEGFKKLANGVEKMTVQKKAWFPEGWEEAENNNCANALEAIDNVFTAFISASDPNEVVESERHPFKITINNFALNDAIMVFRKSVDALYNAKENIIECGRDFSIRLLEQVSYQLDKTIDTLGGEFSPRCNAVMRFIYGYCQRFVPINLMQSFAQGRYYILEKNQKLIRSFEYAGYRGHFIFPLDLDPHFRLGYEHHSGGFLHRVYGWDGLKPPLLYRFLEGGLHQESKTDRLILK